MLYIFKTHEVATNLIQEFIIATDSVKLLTNAEKKFIGLDYDTSQLSLTDKQPIENQLRFYEKNYGYTLVNNIVLKYARNANIDSQNIEFNLHLLSEIELFFIERLFIYSEGNVNLVYKSLPKLKEVECSINSLKYYLNIADPWTAIHIGKVMLQNSEMSKRVDFLHIMALNYNSLGNTLAAEGILQRIIDGSYESASDNKILISSLYILAMTYMRHHPNGIKNMDKAEEYLNKALSLMEEPNFPHHDKAFSSIFNRNGYALILYNQGRIEEAISLLEEKLTEIEPLIAKKGSYIVLHKTVLLYNLYQCYEAMGQIEEAEKALEALISLDFYDLDYRYEKVRFYFNKGDIASAKHELELIEQLQLDDYPTQQAYLGYYYLEINQLQEASKHYKEAYQTNINPRKSNEFLYNYLYTLCALNKFDTVEAMKRSYNLNGSSYKKEIEELFDMVNGEMQV